MGGNPNKASEEAQRAEAARQAAIANTQARVNAVFNDPHRQADIADFVNATRSYYGQDLNRQKEKTDRELKFALARGGLIGGSTQNDQQKQFGEQYSRGLLDVERRAQGAGAELSAADQDARARLIALATSGLDATTAAQQSAAALRSNLEAGRATAQVQGLGDMFSQFSAFAKQAREAADRRRANQDAGFGLYGQPGKFSYGGTP